MRCVAGRIPGHDISLDIHFNGFNDHISNAQNFHAFHKTQFIGFSRMIAAR
jgi:hypothetical protein